MSTMNRPDAQTLNSNAEATVASQAFVKAQKEEDYRPAIATGFIPPVIKEDKPADNKVNSPFKTSHAPVKRPKNIPGMGNNTGDQETEESGQAPANEGPQIAKFMNIPIVEKPASPFVPLGEQPKTVNGLKAPVKRPASASINHAETARLEAEKARLRKELGIKDPEEEKTEEPETAAVNKPASGPKLPPRPVKTSDKTFVPLAPVPYFAEKKEEINPFAAPVQKTEAQLKEEEDRARRAYEQTHTAEKKKSRLDKLMDELNKPIF